MIVDHRVALKGIPAGCCGSAIISSAVPVQCKPKKDGGDAAEVIMGIDEAGRGPVLGPMTYGAAYWSCEDDEAVSAMGFDDSKALTPAQREGLFERIDKVRFQALTHNLKIVIQTLLRNRQFSRRYET